MLPYLPLLLLMGLSVCAGTVDEDLALGAEARSWVTVTLEDGGIPLIQLPLQEVKKGKASQFFGLMGKRVGGTPLIQPERRTAPPLGHQQGQTAQGPLGGAGPSTEGRTFPRQRGRRPGVRVRAPTAHLPGDETPSPNLDITADGSQARSPLRAPPAPDAGVSHPASLNSPRFLPGLSGVRQW
ncbi:tachykinin-4 isoform X1 [Hyaena hyaena]|uniref:tachykinin-4 isoform X1 n=1 Tax=Hyaena hyaena TaxID=95912 RepID=UPI001920C883|nr:tachykinin-4 isoform X1 [Hyaena hyaena]